ncbi:MULTISPECIES: hypothetical protein [Pontibacillus]|uniref:Peptidyl-prolyl cis-trans isomerase n=1 Tax=Pontibacillus chungwhensis TaxID=265426 RepID=A0ABY8V2F9_9BACI|nr:MULTISPECIES: hypothetical protein [Pontibacillus]MCD5322543.1 hypothetical protein [Pontibacillus sp. HN14]WIF99828.1 hypothetical protein QNI29_09260 [Pontibacillus chungwhensis]
MIIQLTGNVNYSITLDPTVWIFDDRKVAFEEAFTFQTTKEASEEDEIKKASQFWDREVYQQKLDPPVNKSISRYDKKKILEGTYVMPIHHFLKNAEINNDAKKALLVTDTGETAITLDELNQSLFLFSQDGKPLNQKGPVHVYFQDGSNKDEPVKGVQKIVID